MFRVMWGREVLDRLSALYDGLDPDQRERLMAAAEAVDAQLAEDPLSAGESRATSLVRIIIAPPLSVAFRVDAQEQIVRVSNVTYRRGTL